MHGIWGRIIANMNYEMPDSVKSFYDMTVPC